MHEPERLRHKVLKVCRRWWSLGSRGIQPIQTQQKPGPGLVTLCSASQSPPDTPTPKTAARSSTSTTTYLTYVTWVLSNLTRFALASATSHNQLPTSNLSTPAFSLSHTTHDSTTTTTTSISSAPPVSASLRSIHPPYFPVTSRPPPKCPSRKPPTTPTSPAARLALNRAPAAMPGRRPSKL